MSGCQDLRSLRSIVASSPSIHAGGAGSSIDLSALTSFGGQYASLGVLSGAAVVVDTLELTAGSTLTGDGTVSGNVVNSSAVAPSFPLFPLLTIDGNYTQTATGTLQIDYSSSTRVDRLVVTGTASLDGTLQIPRYYGTDFPVIGQDFVVVQASSRTGQFASTTGGNIGGGINLTATYSDTEARLHAGPAPDLAVHLDSLQPANGGSQIALGDPLQVTWTVTNIGGDTATGGWTDSLWLSADTHLDRSPGVDLLLLEVPVDPSVALPPGGGAGSSYTLTHTISLPLDVNWPPGDYYILIQTGNGLYESDVLNSIDHTQLLSIVEPSLPDLQLVNFTLPSQANSETEIVINWTDKNTGTADANGPWLDRVVLVPANAPSGTPPVLTYDFSFLEDVPAGQEKIRNQTIVVPWEREGTYRVTVLTDVNNQVSEYLGEGNNTAEADHVILVGPRPSPNLEISSVTAPAVAYAGMQTVVEWTVTNVGTAATDAPFWYDAVWLAYGTGLESSSVFLGDAPNPSYLGPGDSYSNSLEVTLPEGMLGPFHLLVVADERRQVDEHQHEGDNIGYDQAHATEVHVPPAPDLRVTSIVPNVSSTFSGWGFWVNWTVQNDDATGAWETRVADWTDEVYLSTSDTLDLSTALLLGRVEHHGTLILGAQYPAKAEVHVPIDYQGDYYLFVRTDGFDQVKEYAGEGNNVGGPWPLSVVLAPPPDLAVTALQTPSYAVASHGLQISYSVDNIGAGPTVVSSWTDAFYLCKDKAFDPDTDIPLGTRTIDYYPFLSTGSNTPGPFGPWDPPYHKTFGLMLPDGLTGTYYVAVVVNESGAAFELEADKANNVAWSADPVEIVSTPADLVVSSSDAPSFVWAGEAANVSWVVTNQGTGDTVATSWTDSVYLSPDPVFDPAQAIFLRSVTHVNTILTTGPIWLVPMHVGESYQRRFIPVTVPYNLVGDYYWFIVTDTGNAVYEDAAEDNNVTPARPVSIARQFADLQVASVAAPGDLVSGGQLQVTWTVQNFGDGRTNVDSWEDAVYLSTDQTIDKGDIELGRFTVSGGCGPAGTATDHYSHTKTFTLPENLSGSYYVLVRTDAGGAVFEGTAANENGNDGSNEGQTTVTLCDVPDLVADSVQAPVTAVSGQSFGLTWTVRNVGPAAAYGSWYDLVYLSLDSVFDPASDLYVGFVPNTRSLDVGDSYTTTADIGVPRGRAGLYYVFVLADGKNDVNERDGETNNFACDPFFTQVNLLPPVDLVAGIITLPPDTQAGQPVTVQYTVHNNSATEAVGRWYDSVYVSSDPQWDLGDPLLHQVRHAGSVEAHDSYSEQFIAPLPGVLTGQHYLIVRSDIRNQLPESNEANNLAASLDRFAVDVPVLVPGVPVTGAVDYGQSLYYRIEVPAEQAGQALVIQFSTDQTAVANELYVSYGEIPTRIVHEFSPVEALSFNPMVIVPRVQSGTYYILALGDPQHARDGLLGNFTLRADCVGFSVTDTNYNQGGTAGNRTIEIHGTLFDRTVTAKLVAANGTEAAATRYYRVDSTKLYATFDLTTVEPGMYDLVARNAAGEEVVVTDGLEVVQTAEIPECTPYVTPQTVFKRRWHVWENETWMLVPFTVSWINNSLNDIPAPIFVVTSSEPFSADYDKAQATGVGVYADMFFANTDDSPPGVLLPGASASRTYYSIPLLAGDTDASLIRYYINPLYRYSTATFDWNSMRDMVAADRLTSDDFARTYESFVGSVGSTNADYLDMLSETYPLLGTLSDDVPAASQTLLQEAFDRFAAATHTSLVGQIHYDALYLESDNLSVTAMNTVTYEAVTGNVRTDGSFVFPVLDPGTYQLSIAGGAVAANPDSQVTIVDDEHEHVSVPIVLAGTLSGNVNANATGDPLDEAIIHIVSTDGLRQYYGYCNGDGAFQIADIAPATYNVTVTSSPYVKFTSTVTVMPASRAVLDVQLTDASIVTGTVTDEVGNRLASALVWAKRLSDAELLLTTTDDDGNYQLDGLDTGVWEIWASQTDYVESDLIVLDITEPAASTRSFTLSLGGSISGTITAPDGSAIAGAVVTSSNDYGFLTPVQTSSDGTYTITGLSLGDFTVAIDADQYARLTESVHDMELQEHRANVDYTLSVGRTLSGIVSDAAGNPLAGVSVTLQPNSGESPTRLTTDTTGAFSAQHLAPDVYVCTFALADYVPSRRMLDLHSSDATNVELALLLRPGFFETGSAGLCEIARARNSP